MTMTVRPVDAQLVVLNDFQRFGDGQAAVAGFVAHRLIDGLAGGRDNQDFFVGAVRGAAQRFAASAFCPRPPALAAAAPNTASARCARMARAWSADRSPRSSSRTSSRVRGSAASIMSKMRDLFGDHRVHGEQLVAFAVMRFARRADAHADRVDDLFDQRRADRRARRPGSSAPTSSTRSARVNALLSMRATTRASARAVSQHARRGAPRAARFEVRRAVEFQTARIARAIPRLSSAHGLRFGLGGPGGFLRGRELLRGRFAVDDDQVVARPFPQPGGAPRPRLEALFGDAGDLGHPGTLVDGAHSAPRSACSS